MFGRKAKWSRRYRNGTPPAAPGPINSSSPGASAYELWLADGNTGTLDDFFMDIGCQAIAACPTTIGVHPIASGSPFDLSCDIADDDAAIDKLAAALAARNHI